MTAARCLDCGAITVKDSIGAYVIHHKPDCPENPFVQFEVRLTVIEHQDGVRHQVFSADVEATWDPRDVAVTEFSASTEPGVRQTVPIWAVMSVLTDALDRAEQKQEEARNDSDQ